MISDFNSVQSGQRVHIGFFGCANSGKSSLINAIAGQNVSIVSNIKGTTTDPVRKSMELLPIGPVMLYDTAGLDDDTALSSERRLKTYEVLRHTDIAVLVIEQDEQIKPVHRELMKDISARNIPVVTVYSKCDKNVPVHKLIGNSLCVSAVTGKNINALKELIAKVYQENKVNFKPQPLIEDLVEENSLVLLVTPIDEAAPKGRIILPQVQTIRAALDSYAICITVQPENLKSALKSLSRVPDIVITDSQAFGYVKDVVPQNIPLTSFSILMARYKGTLTRSYDGIKALRKLRDGDTVLISEACTHHRQCGDIGTIKLPAAVRKITGKNLNFQFTSGGDFPENLSMFSLVIHCGGCMLNAKEMEFRRNLTQEQNVPFTNFGMVLAEAQGILDRAVDAVL